MKKYRIFAKVDHDGQTLSTQALLGYMTDIDDAIRQQEYLQKEYPKIEFVIYES